VIKRIIVDIDDTLNSLTMHIMQHFGCSVGPFDYDKHPGDGNYDVKGAIKELGGDCPDSYTDFWNEVTCSDLWRSAPKSKECDWLLRRCADIVGHKNVILATRPITKRYTEEDRRISAVSHAHKIEWIWEQLPPWIHEQYSITPCKWEYGTYGSLLIDDHSYNCNRFRERGGSAILVPRPWNERFADNTEEMLIRDTEGIIWEREEDLRYS
jgi:hypothetical protein